MLKDINGLGGMSEGGRVLTNERQIVPFPITRHTPMLYQEELNLKSSTKSHGLYLRTLRILQLAVSLLLTCNPTYTQVSNDLTKIGHAAVLTDARPSPDTLKAEVYLMVFSSVLGTSTAGFGAGILALRLLQGIN